jgi:hypothetical protein
VTRIRECPHEPKVVIGGTILDICKHCRNENIRTFYASGPLLPTAKPNGGRGRGQWGGWHDMKTCCRHHMGLRSDGGQDD